MSSVREINDLQQLAEFRLLWHNLLAETRAATFFHSLDWLETYWRHFGAGARLRVLIVHSHNLPIGILPLVIRTRRYVGSVRVLGYPLDNWGSVYGPIGPNPMATLAAGLAHLQNSPRDWDLVELAWVDVAGSDGGRTSAAMAMATWEANAEPWQTRALIDLAAHGTWNSYWASRTTRWRNNVRRAEKKLNVRGCVTYVRYRPRGGAAGDADPRWDLYNSCERIARASWQGASRTGTTLSHEKVRPFLRECHEVAARAGTLDLNLLLVNNVPLAFNYAYHCAGSVFGLRTGYDREAAREGAGTVLQRRMIEDSFARGDQVYDLGADYLDGKRYWQTRTRTTYRYTHFASRALMAQLARVRRGLRRLMAE